MADWDVVSKEPISAAAAPAGGDPWAVVSHAPVDAPVDRTTWLQRAWQGMAKDPGHATGQAIAHGLSSAGLYDPKPADKRLVEQEQAYQAERGPNAGKFDWARTIGEGVTAGFLGQRLGPAASGALSGALTPITDEKDQEKFWQTKGEQTAGGAILGKGAALAGSAIAQAIKPTFNKAVQTLVDAGVSLTPGQLVQGAGKRLEEIAKSVPVVGDVIRNGYARSIESFNRVAADKALAPIGATIPRAIAPGHEMAQFGDAAMSKAYDQALQKVHSWTFDQQAMQQASRDIGPIYQDMTDATKAMWENLFDNRLSRLSQAGTVDAAGYKQLEEEVTHQIGNWHNVGDPDRQLLGDAFDRFKDVMKDTLERQNPQAAADLSAANTAYAGWSRVREAIAKARGEPFRPVQLAQAIEKRANTTGAQGSLGRGVRMLQPFAEAAQSVLPDKMPNSTTTDRWLTAAALGAGGAEHTALTGAIASHPLAALGLGGAATMYTKPGMAAVNAWADNGILGPVQSGFDLLGRQTGAQFLQTAAQSFPNLQRLLAQGARQGGAALAPVAGAAGASLMASPPTNALAPFTQPPQQPAQ